MPTAPTLKGAVAAPEVFAVGRVDCGMYRRTDGGTTPLAEAVSTLAAAVGSIDRTRHVPVEEAASRALAEPVAARRDVPHYPRSERDGWAVRSEETAGASEAEPVELSAGSPPLEPGTASYVHTGSAVPAEADAVVMIEHVEETPDGIRLTKPVEAGAYVTPQGTDVEAGERLYEAGHRLRPGDLGTLKVTGVDAVTAVEPPTVAVIPTGEELVQSDPGPGEVVETNGLVGSALVDHWCGRSRYHEVVTDDAAALATAIERDRDADLIVTSGGSSVGARDVLPGVVADRGEMLVEGLALRPGHSASVGVVDGTPIAMLPGTPVAALVVAWLLVRPVLARAVGTTAVSPPTVQAALGWDLESPAGRRSVHGVAIENEDEPVAHRVDRGGLPALPETDGWLQVPESTTGISAGETVTVEQWGAGGCP